jgi:trehalose 6-phosphate phosphatase
VQQQNWMARPDHAGHTRAVTSALGSEALLAPLRDDPARAAILLDVDGTLAPIVEQPSAARVPASTRELLTRLVERYGLVACVSGRRASEARALVSIGSITYLGAHGAELLRAGGTEPVLDPRLKGWAERIHQFGRRSDTPDLAMHRVRLEDKGAILAYHWRSAPDEEAARATVVKVANRAEALGFHTHWGRKVLEVRPPVQFDKGVGVTNLLDGLDLDAVMYAGDDLTDLDAFRSIVRLAEEGRISRAIRVGVKSPEAPHQVLSEADVLVDGPSGVAELLSLLLID